MDLMELLNKRLDQVAEQQVSREMSGFYNLTDPGYNASKDEFVAQKTIVELRRARRTKEIRTALVNKLVDGLIETHVKSKS